MYFQNNNATLLVSTGGIAGFIPLDLNFMSACMTAVLSSLMAHL